MRHPVKTLYAVTFDQDEPPHYCVAESEDEALSSTLSYAAELDISVLDPLLVDSEGIYADFEDFESRYSLRSNPHDPIAGLGGILFGATGIEWDAVSRSPLSTIWTLVECDGVWWISPGIHFVNRLGYLLTNEARARDERDYLYE